MTRNSFGRTQIVWALALSGLLVGGGLVGARAAGLTQAAAHQTTAGQTTTIPPPQRDGRSGAPGRGAGGPGSSFGPGWNWWTDADVKKEIGLRPEQSNHIEGIYNRRSKNIELVIPEYSKEKAALEKMISDRTVDENELDLQVTKVNALWSRISSSRTLMLYSIFRVLDADQYTRLKGIFERHAREMEQRRGRGGVPAPALSGLFR